MSTPIALTIAGSDSSGAAGLQADLPTFAAFGVHGTSALTVVTAQYVWEIAAFHQIPHQVLAAQLDALLEDIPPAATKTGLLRTHDAVSLVEQRAPALGLLVVDPVSTDSEGHLLISPETVAAYRRLAAAATVLTPNMWEAELLVGAVERLDTDAVVGAAEQFRDLGADRVVITGGRGEGDTVRGVVVGQERVDILSSPRLAPGEPIRGTGCTFSAAIAAGLALGRSPTAAIDRAHSFVQDQLARLRPSLSTASGDGGRPALPHHI